MQRVTREIVIDAPVPTIWRHLEDPAQRRGWLGGELDVELTPGREGTFVTPGGSRPVRVDDVEEGRSVTFTWGEHDTASQVTIELEPAGEASRVRVTETTDADVRHDATDADRVDRANEADAVGAERAEGTEGTEGDAPSGQPTDGGGGSELPGGDGRGGTGGDAGGDGGQDAGGDAGDDTVASVTSLAGHVRRTHAVDPPSDLPEEAPAREATPLVTSPWARAA